MSEHRATARLDPFRRSRPPARVTSRSSGSSTAPRTAQRTSFVVVTGTDASVELDDLVAVDQTLPDGEVLTHYGMVVGLDRGHRRRELVERHRAGDRCRRCPARRSAAPRCGSCARSRSVGWHPSRPRRSAGRSSEERSRALFMDQMENRLAVGSRRPGAAGVRRLRLRQRPQGRPRQRLGHLRGCRPRPPRCSRCFTCCSRRPTVGASSAVTWTRPGRWCCR